MHDELYLLGQLCKLAVFFAAIYLATYIVMSL